MADSKFWRELAKEFHALPEDNTFAEKVIDGLPGTIPPPSDRWHLYSNSPDIAMQFEDLARQGGDQLSPGDIVDSLQVWIDALYSLRLNIEEKNLMQRLPGEGLSDVVIQFRTRISRLSETSKLFCRTKALQAAEEERVKRAVEAQENDPRNWSALRQHLEATQAIKAVMTSTAFEITEDFVREAVARHDGIKPEQVTAERINWEVSGMLPRHPHIRLIPSKPPDLGDSGTAATPSVRSTQVGAFLQRCNSVSSARIYKRHIWLCAGHSKGRQFEFWQACSSKATSADNRNFGRILSMEPSAFVDLLKQKHLID